MYFIKMYSVFTVTFSRSGERSVGKGAKIWVQVKNQILDIYLRAPDRIRFPPHAFKALP